MTAIPAATTPAPAGNHYDKTEPKTPGQLGDTISPGARQIQLGQVLVDLVTQVNNLVADLTALRTKYQAFLTHVDTGNVAGIGNTNVATYGDTALTSAVIQQLGAR